MENNGVQVFKDLGAALPDAKLFGPGGLAVSSFTKDVPADIAARSYITVATIDPKDYPAEGQKFFKDFEAEYERREENRSRTPSTGTRR